MGQKRILVIQDISCVGKCSMTIALPVLSAFGHGTSILPSALLSTHTGGFGKPAVIYFGNQLESFRKHWQEQRITFDAILTGYLGDTAAVESAREIIERLLSPGGISIVDPAMADNGRLYAGLDERYVRGMRALCRRADIVLPNATEAAMLSGITDKDDGIDRGILNRLHYPCTVVTGVERGAEQIGVILKEGTQIWEYDHPKTERSFHGTGDFFAACFAGALLQGRGKQDAIRISCELTRRCIENTLSVSDSRFGLRFEPILRDIFTLMGDGEWGGEQTRS